jgi:hypothetical protein
MLKPEPCKRVIENKLRIVSQADSKLVPFILYPEQQRLLKEICTSKKIVICKSRQIGSSTLCLAYAALTAIARPNISIAIVANKQPTTQKLMADLKAFLNQMGVGKLLVDSASRIQLPNYTNICAITAGATEPGRGYTFSLILCSEAAYYRDSIATMNALLNASAKKSQIILESTASSDDTHFRRMWDGDTYTKFFSPFEAHANYRLPAHSITDDEWDVLRNKYNFSRRDSAAFWLSKYKDNGSDDERTLREFPILPEHAFIASSGRWINVDPPVLPYTRDEQHPKIKYFTPFDKTHKYVYGVDTAAGNGGDDSVCVVYDTTTRKIAALFADNNTKIDDFVHIINKIANIYRPEYLFVETNGIGEGTTRLLQSKGHPVVEYTANQSDRYIGFLWARNQVKAGLAADEQFLRNCQSCQVEQTVGGQVKFSGQKDIIAALSFIGVNKSIIDDMASRPPPRVVPEGAWDKQAHLRKIQSRNKPKTGLRPI